MREGIISNGFFGVDAIIDADNEWSGASVGIKLDSLHCEITILNTRERLQALGRLNQVKAYRSSSS